MMSKKHYVQIAQMIKSRREFWARQNNHDGMNQPTGKKQCMHETEHYAYELADIFASDNPNFNRSRFLNACGLASK